MSDMKSKTVCFTGHREIPAIKTVIIKSRLKMTLKALIDEGYCYFGSGGALGFDTMAAQCVLELRRENPQVKLILVLPCKNQADRWSESDCKVYEDIKSRADKIVYTSEYYHSGCMHKRNRHLVDNSSVCVCYLTKNSGGTAYTVDYAKSKELRIVNIACE